MSASILRVAVGAPLHRLFDYKAPAGAPAGKSAVGCRVRVPFGRRRVTGLVMDVAARSELPASRLKTAIEVLDEEPVFAADELWLIRFTSDYYHHPVGEVVAAALPSLLRQGRPLTDTEELVSLTGRGAEVDTDDIARRAPRQAELLAILKERGACPSSLLDDALPNWRRVARGLVEKAWIETDTRPALPPEPAVEEPVPGPSLSAEQRRALETIGAGNGFGVTLLDGVTGSGKTEVYLQSMLSVIAGGRQVLVLVPEIGLTPQFVRRLTERLGTVPAVLHSGLTDTERLDAWRRARSGRAGVVLGTRSAVFAPLARPGLIVVDEEHDASFKQQEGLRYSARDLAVARGKQLDVPVVLGTATPSLDSLQRVADGAYRHAVLSARAGGALPPHVRLVDVNRFRNAEGLSPPLIDAIGTHLDQGGQALVYLNRRGYAPTLICNACGHIAECRRCDSRMTVHRREQSLTCHHCGSQRPLDPSCSECGGQVVPLGEGTERIEDVLARHFPGQEITRIDSDSMRLKGAMDRALSMAVTGEARILVGTQMLSKGHHFPKLTLVGVVNADQGLFSTDFRGAERLAQTLIQVSGRAGRVRRQGEVLIQTAFPEHRFWGELLAGGYERVAAYSLAERRDAGWPPYSRLALIRASAHQKGDAMAFLEKVAAQARKGSGEHPDVRVLGPVSAPMERLAGRYRCQLLIQSASRGPLHAVLNELCRPLENDPAGRRVRWSIDVDPIELF